MDNFLRVSEIYLSIQGEGPRVGSPTVFIRFGGCNLRCPLWPCDSQFAVDPKFRKEWIRMSPEQVAAAAMHAAAGFDNVNICLTGGEPFLQQGKALEELVWLLSRQREIEVIECFSNGTLPYPRWALDDVAFVVDWKLLGSGEAETGTAVRLENLKHLIWGEDVIKFTIAGEEDYLMAKVIYEEHVLPHSSMMEVFAGVVWGKLTNEELVSWMLRDHLPWRLNVQVHNHVWDRNKRGI